MSNFMSNHALSLVKPRSSVICKLVTQLIQAYCLLAICSLSVHAGVHNADRKKRSSSKQKHSVSHHNHVRHGKVENFRRWPGQGDPKVERVRRCVRSRESRGNYRIVDKKGRWFGAYQFDINTSNTAAKRMKRPDLVGVPANKWTISEQDSAFYVIYDRGHGKSHFYHSKSKCF